MLTVQIHPKTSEKRRKFSKPSPHLGTQSRCGGSCFPLTFLGQGRPELLPSCEGQRLFLCHLCQHLDVPPHPARHSPPWTPEESSKTGLQVAAAPSPFPIRSQVLVRMADPPLYGDPLPFATHPTPTSRCDHCGYRFPSTACDSPPGRLAFFPHLLQFS